MSEKEHSSDEPNPAEWKRKAAMIAPLALFFLAGMFVDTSPTRDGESINGSAYLMLVALRVVLMSAAMLYFGREILRQFPFSVDRYGWLVGVVGAVLWIGICGFEPERKVLTMLNVASDWLPAREGVNPFETYAPGLQLGGFLLLRFTLLALCIPIAEELFLRGFIMRAFEVENWTELPVAKISMTGMLVGTLYGVLTHPGEIVAAALWFSMVTVLMKRTGKFWNCVVAHAVTNLILGIYVCVQGQWQLW